MRVAFLGLGDMGRPMAENFVKSGIDTTVWNRSLAKTRPLQDKGAKVAETPAKAVEGADVVFTMLYDDKAVDEITFGPYGFAPALKKGGAHICGTTISTQLAKDMYEKHLSLGQRYISATVLGRPPAAEQGDLFVVVGGDAHGFEALFDIIGQRTFYVGSNPVLSNIAKLSLNFMIFATIQQMSEVFSTVEKAGLDPHKMFEIMTNSFYSAPVHKNYGSLMVDRNYDSPGSPGVGLALKDTELFLEAGRSLAVPQPVASMVRDRYLSCIANGDENRDFVALQERYKEDAGLNRKKDQSQG